MCDPLYEKMLSTKTVYQGRIVSVRHDQVKLENGSQTLREIVEHVSGAGILAVDQEDRVLFVRQFRYAAGRELLEIPAGMMEPGEKPEVSAMRELEEETGFRAGKLTSFGMIYPTPGYLTEALYLYLAVDLIPTRQRLDEDEFLSVERIPYDQALKMCLDGTVVDAKTITAMLKYHIMIRAK